jgi:hypothetical protein
MEVVCFVRIFLKTKCNKNKQIKQKGNKSYNLVCRQRIAVLLGLRHEVVLDRSKLFVGGATRNSESLQRDFAVFSVLGRRAPPGRHAPKPAATAGVPSEKQRRVAIGANKHSPTDCCVRLWHVPFRADTTKSEDDVGSRGRSKVNGLNRGQHLFFSAEEDAVCAPGWDNRARVRTPDKYKQ